MESDVGASTQVFAVVVHAPHVGDDAPGVQDETRVCVMLPVCPTGHESVCVCGDAGSGMHAGACTVQDAYWYDAFPENTPFEHERGCATEEQF